jgi:hypothetical protein
MMHKHKSQIYVLQTENNSATLVTESDKIKGGSITLIMTGKATSVNIFY